MCSTASSPGQVTTGTADVAERLARAIDECAAAARQAAGAADADVAGRLAAIWGILTESDPELADRAARYAGS
jgi:hypothetical protein